MRFWIMMLLAWPAAMPMALASSAGTVGPLEQPPDDFTGAQYIDTAGCVYLRQGPVWAPRLDRDGSVICGYPPSLPGLAANKAETPDAAALRLAITLAEGLQDGDVLADPPDLLRRAPAEVPRPVSGPLARLDASVRAVPAMRAAAAQQSQPGQMPLCDLLGYRTGGVGAGDARTLGFCGGGDSDLQPKSRAGGPPPEMVGPAPVAPANSARAETPAAKAAIPAMKREAAGHGRTASGKATGTVAAKPVPAAPVKPAQAASMVEMIPAGARYVLIGRYPLPAEAEATMRRLAALGYPVARSRSPGTGAGGRLVMAGPFADRQALVAALNRLREQGYTRAVAR